MDTSKTTQAAMPAKRCWRRHDEGFKARVIDLARAPHASVAAVALANGLNANMLRRWVREAEHGTDAASSAHAAMAASPSPPAFIQLPIPTMPSPATIETTVFVEIHRGGTSVYVTLPSGLDSAAWVREVLA